MNTSIDDSTICRLAQSMLKTQSMFQKLCSVNPSKLLPQQLEQLKIVNQSLSTQFTTTNVCSSKAFFDDDVSNSESVSENSVNAYDINNQEIFLKIVHYLRGLQLSAELNLLMMSQQAKLELRIKVLRDSNDLLKSEQNNVLTEMKENFKSLEAELHSLDFELFACKEKLKRVQLLLKDKVKYELAIKESRSFLCADIDIIDSVIKNLVGDACLAAVILVRCGYLPDHIRAETFDVFRNAIKKDFTCTESPFVLGSLVDRLQLRSWTQHGKEFCVRDIPTINSLSLLYLCPYNIFIIDPEGISLKSIINSWNCIYDCYEVNGKGFSLASLSIWAEKTVVADQICMVIVYDVQSGVSNDLIAFLCGEYYESEITGAERNEALGDKDNSISFIFNPHHLTYTDSKRFGKVKLILISSEPPTIDNNGIGRPLPSSCFNSLTIIHWVNCNIISPCLYESRPALWWSNKIFASSYLNEFCYFKYLAEKIAPDHFSKLNLLGTRLVDCTIDLFATEHMALSSIMQWEKRQAINSIDSPIYSKFVSLPRVSLCFLEDEECCQSLLGAVSRRNVTKNVITNTKLLERESLAYQKVISETFSLASELLKMSNLIIPDHLFPPHSLTSPNLMKRVAKSLIDNANNSKYLKKIPLSLRHMHKITNAISLLQRKFQEHLGNQGRDVSEALDYSKKNRSPLKPNSVRATLRNSNRSSLFAQKNPEQKTSKRRWSLVRKLSKPIEGQKRKFTHLLKEFKIDEFIALSPSKRR